MHVRTKTCRPPVAADFRKPKATLYRTPTLSYWCGMPIKMRYRCLNCGKRFEIDVVTPDEREEARREEQPLYDIQCPACHRSSYREGWD